MSFWQEPSLKEGSHNMEETAYLREKVKQLTKEKLQLEEAVQKYQSEIKCLQTIVQLYNEADITFS